VLANDIMGEGVWDSIVDILSGSVKLSLKAMTNGRPLGWLEN